MHILGRAALLITAAVLALGATQVGAAEDDPGTRSLAGEEFLVNDVTMTLDCDTAGVSTVHFSASGPATGPYPGTFTASGTVTIEPQTLPGSRPGTVAGSLLSLTETFHIDSPLGTVDGEKSLPEGLPFDTSNGTCQQVSNFATGPVTDAEGTVVDLFSQPTYTATIQEPGGTFQVHGEASLSSSEVDVTGLCLLEQCQYRLAAFVEGFMTSTPGEFCDENEQGDQDADCEDQDP